MVYSDIGFKGEESRTEDTGEGSVLVNRTVKVKFVGS